MEGIIYKTIPYRDGTEIIYLLTPEGKASYIARGSLKVSGKSFRYTQQLTHLEFEPLRRTLKYLKMHNDYLHIKESYERLLVALDILTLIDRIGDATFSAPHALFEVTKLTLDLLNRGINPQLVWLVFLIKATYGFGINPQLRQCTICESEKIVGFDSSLGGMVCSTHMTLDSLGRDASLAIINLYYLKGPDLENYLQEFPSDSHHLIKHFEYYYEVHLGYYKQRREQK